MSALRKQAYKHDGLPVAYADEVSADQIKQVGEMVRDEFVGEDWVTVEQES